MTEKSALRATHPANTLSRCFVLKRVNQIIRLDPASLALQNNKTSSGKDAVAVTTRARLSQAALGEDHNISVLAPLPNFIVTSRRF